MKTENTPATILIAEDDEALRSVLARAVMRDGFVTTVVPNGDEAVAAISNRSFDIILSDIDMPGRSGIELLKAIRERDLDVPVILITGNPHIETAISAVEYGATHYLTKPVDMAMLSATVRRAVQAGRLARARRDLVGLSGPDDLQISDLAGLAAHFDRALPQLLIHCQPIVRWSTRTTFAYEALLRSREPMLPGPLAMFDAAERLNRTAELGRRIREILPVAEHPDARLFVNLHPNDLSDDTLFDPASPLAMNASRVVLEITERARLETIPEVPQRIARLRELGFEIAIDDIGAGYAGLTSFAALEPNYMKLDRALVENMHESRTKMRLVGAMINACNDLGVNVIGEGVETASERDALVELGCDLLQGYLFAKPQPPFPDATF